MIEFFIGLLIGSCLSTMFLCLFIGGHCGEE